MYFYDEEKLKNVTKPRKCTLRKEATSVNRMLYYRVLDPLNPLISKNVILENISPALSRLPGMVFEIL